MDTGKRSWFRRRRSAPSEPIPKTVRPDDNPDDENRRAVDVCFVFDTTASMSDKITGLVACMVDFVGELSELQLNWRITTVPYGDLTVSGDKVVADLPFVRSHDDAVRQLRTMPRFSGGNNYGESTLEAVTAALGKPYRPHAVPVLVVLTDEPPLTENLNEAQVGEQITIKEAICFVASPDRPGYRRWADANGGQWYEIGQRMDTTQILAYLRSLAHELPQVAQEVHDLGGGSVRRYLQQKGDPGQRR
ncbi:vWA domain-containing protein [Actinoplanes flavus]|uniref:VWA domain-containing protein n=1 Tax=Actinoplanes flavus TaxID=2820290 RepID=A0ABS3UWT3_9ACTN|nr:vWA domain-containing protein [Actinoplanes flavus]MBO3743043.1 VWA domain-containing protein [Actinoplanes flavus]